METQFLKDRAKEFWQEAVELIEKGRYNLAVFHLEQACQLWLKYLIFKKVGDFPKTHYFSQLISEFYKVYESKPVLDFYQNNELFFDNLEDAYFISRYYPKLFTENSAQSLREFVEKFINLTQEISGENFF